MAIGNPYDREYFVIGGAVKTTGGSLNLAKGELALVDQMKTSLAGVTVLSIEPARARDAWSPSSV